nr:hypothetical protein [Streptomyces sp. DSM 41633]
MAITRTGVSLHAAGTVAEWLGHVLNLITGRMDRPGGRRFEPGYVDTLRLAGLAATRPHTSRLAGRGLVATLAHPLYGELRRATAGEMHLSRIRGRLARRLASEPDGDMRATVRRALLALHSDLPPDPELYLT